MDKVILNNIDAKIADQFYGFILAANADLMDTLECNDTFEHVDNITLFQERQSNERKDAKILKYSQPNPEVKKILTSILEYMLGDVVSSKEQDNFDNIIKSLSDSQEIFESILYFVHDLVSRVTIHKDSYLLKIHDPNNYFTQKIIGVLKQYDITKENFALDTVDLFLNFLRIIANDMAKLIWFDNVLAKKFVSINKNKLFSLLLLRETPTEHIQTLENEIREKDKIAKIKQKESKKAT